LHLPLILTFNISVLNFSELKKYIEDINFYFSEEIKIKNNIYKLIGLILYKNNKHYVSLFKNTNPDFLIDKNIWYYYDDVNEYVELLDNNNIGFNNIIPFCIKNLIKL